MLARCRHDACTMRTQCTDDAPTTHRSRPMADCKAADRNPLTRQIDDALSSSSSCIMPSRPSPSHRDACKSACAPSETTPTCQPASTCNRSARRRPESLHAAIQLQQNDRPPLLLLRITQFTTDRHTPLILLDRIAGLCTRVSQLATKTGRLHFQ